MLLGLSFTLVFLLVLIELSHGGQNCSSCSGVEGGSACQHIVTCSDDEVCIMQHYTTESSSVAYDYGCASNQVCHHSSGPIFGRRAEGHHSICFQCCNDTSLCNQNLKCSTTPQIQVQRPRECSEVKEGHPNMKSGVYTIYPYRTSDLAVSVYCKFVANGLAWTVIQKRFNGFVNFYRNWEAYKEGFGSADGEYWLGNEIIHELTSHANHDLRVELSDFDGVTKYAEYTLFSVGDEENKYRLTVFNYSGNAGDSLTLHNGMQFSTYDMDNDVGSTANCAARYKCAWWYEECHDSNLNGQYLAGQHASYADGLNWVTFRGYHYSLKSDLMMIRKY